MVALGNAAQISHLLGLGTERRGESDSFASEIRRRRFWACYLMHCHAIEMGFTMGSGQSAMLLTLPWKEEDFEAGIPTNPSICLQSGESNASIFSELIRALTFW